jgi:hypothetical protein
MQGVIELNQQITNYKSSSGNKASSRQQPVQKLKQVPLLAKGDKQSPIRCS